MRDRYLGIGIYKTYTTVAVTYYIDEICKTVNRYGCKKDTNVYTSTSVTVDTTAVRKDREKGRENTMYSG